MSQPLLDEFISAYESIAGVAHVATGMEEAVTAVARVLDQAEARTVAIAQLPEELAAAIESLCRDRDVTLLREPYAAADLPHGLDDVQVGITGIDFAVAQSGTLVEFAHNDATRLVSSLPRTHIGVLPADKIVATLHDAAPRLREVFNGPNAAVTASFISGPSRTGDIEMILTLGVHGPEKAHALLLA